MPRRFAVVFSLLFLASTLLACATTQKEGTSSPSELKPRAGYYDFEDILIPSELTLQKKDSFVYAASRMKVGLLSLKGRVEPDSLAAFFQNNMQKDGWRSISTIKFREIMLLFLKDERACVITIKEKIFTTYLEVWVGPIEQALSPVKGTPPR